LPREVGFAAALALGAREDCTHAAGSSARAEWMTGYEAGHGERRPIDEASAPEGTPALPAAVSLSRPIHPAASIFPMMNGDELAELADDIKTRGLRERIWLMPTPGGWAPYSGAVLDGRNRLAACELAGVEPSYNVYRGDDPVGFVVSLNLKRRHLSESQRALVAAKIANLDRGANQHSEGPSIEGASDMLNVGHASVERAKSVIAKGAPELVAAVEAGAVSVAAAADLAKALSHDEQAELLARCDPKAVVRAARSIRHELIATHRATKLGKIGELARSGRPLLPDLAARYPDIQRWPIILADPAWRYEKLGHTERAVENHYQTMPIDEICALPVAEIATSTAVLFLWCPGAILAAGWAHRVADAWGFALVSQLVWDKGHIGVGSWVRNRHENVMIGVRGDFPPPPQGPLVPDSLFAAPRGAHSAKPDRVHEIIEAAWPDLPRLELFARLRDDSVATVAPRPGWAVWGNEAVTISTEAAA
jgi:N6-adenosine-specific RNA methylase IME4